MVFARNDETIRYTGTPYYWIVDLPHRVLLVQKLMDGRYVLQTRARPGEGHQQ